MKLLFAGSHVCTYETLKRLLLVGDHLSFTDRPSVRVTNGGLVGTPSPLRGIENQLDSSPLTASFYEVISFSEDDPKSLARQQIFEEYIISDIRNVNFRRLVFQGLFQDPKFTKKFIQLDATYYDSRSGSHILKDIVDHPELVSEDYHELPDFANLPKDDMSGRKARFGGYLADVSAALTCAMLTAEEHGFSPVTDDNTFQNLLHLRMADENYIGVASEAVPYLGLEVCKSAIPDECLAHLSALDIINYRREANDAYVAWSREISRIAWELENASALDREKVVAKIVSTSTEKKVEEYHHEMRAVADKLFGDLVKKVATTEFASLSIAYCTHLGISTSLAMFGGLVVGATPALVDWVQARRNVKRKNYMTYLIGVNTNLVHKP